MGGVIANMCGWGTKMVDFSGSGGAPNTHVYLVYVLCTYTDSPGFSATCSPMVYGPYDNRLDAVREFEGWLSELSDCSCYRCGDVARCDCADVAERYYIVLLGREAGGSTPVSPYDVLLSAVYACSHLSRGYK